MQARDRRIPACLEITGNQAYSSVYGVVWEATQKYGGTPSSLPGAGGGLKLVYRHSVRLPGDLFGRPKNFSQKILNLLVCIK
jgi:hypothetical protein